MEPQAASRAGFRGDLEKKPTSTGARGRSPRGRLHPCLRYCALSTTSARACPRAQARGPAVFATGTADHRAETRSEDEGMPAPIAGAPLRLLSCISTAPQTPLPRGPKHSPLALQAAGRSQRASKPHRSQPWGFAIAGSLSAAETTGAALRSGPAERPLSSSSPTSARTPTTAPPRIVDFNVWPPTSSTPPGRSDAIF
jgi:hypothetical protein